MKAGELFLLDDRAVFQLHPHRPEVYRFTGSGNITGTVEVETVGALDSKRYRRLSPNGFIRTQSGQVIVYFKTMIDNNTTVKVVDVPQQTGGERVSWLDIMAGVAQGAINVTEAGSCSIEKDSRVHRAMVALCERFSAVENGREGLPPQWKQAAAHLAGYEEE